MGGVLTLPLNPRLTVNVLANITGRFASIVLGLLCTPVYIGLLGVESYGLIGFFVTIQASLVVLEMGLRSACIKELSTYSGRGVLAYNDMHFTLHVFEVVYVSMGLIVGVGIYSLAPWIAINWLNDTSFSPGKIELIIKLIAWVIALRWPASLYSAVLMGLQRQVLFNVVTSIIAALNWLGSIVVLLLFVVDVENYFAWQIVISIISTSIFCALAWSSMPKRYSNIRFSWSHIKRIAAFSSKVGGNAGLGAILLQADKLVLSTILSLEMYGFYMVAVVIANVTATIASPFSDALFPRFSQLLGRDNSSMTVSELYRVGSQAIAVLTISFALVVALFSREVLVVFSGNEALANQTAVVLSILVVAKLFHASVMLPYCLQVSFDQLRLPIIINIASIIWLVPAVYVLSSEYGMVGGAVSWLLVTCAYVFVGLPLMHRMVLQGEYKYWLFNSFLRPVLGVFLFLLMVSLFCEDLVPDGRFAKILFIISLYVMAVGLAILLVPDLKKKVKASGLFSRNNASY